MNGIPNWVPEYYNDTKYLPEDMPRDLKEYIEQQKNINPQLLKTVWISCQGENPADKEFIGPVDYLPQRGFPGYFFPYNTSKKGYLSPLVAVHFQRIMTGVLVNVECRLWAPNIEYDREKGSGYVHFELLVE
ncbi:Sodium/potassium-transporting ATPase subunit beta-2 [Blattella germanica]|nr:Sodium/potassium-transporting ATPase subunit beta-2 [Blattella germanica]